MTKRIFRSICTVAIAVFLAAVVLIMGVLYGYFSQVQQNQLRMQTSLAAQGVTHEGPAFFENLATEDYRITWIASDGQVLYDSQKDSAEMESHLEREEVQEALEAGYGQSQRYSDTLMEKSLYSAQRLEDGTVLRLSMSQSSILTLVLGMAQPICVVFVVAIVLSLILAYRLSKRIVEPLNEINLDAPLSNEGYDELAPFLRRIDSQQKQLRRQANQLQNRKDEFEAVTGSMSEGLILLNPKGTILSINNAAAKLLDTNHYCEGKNILTVSRNLELQEVLSKAIVGEASEKVISLREGFYQVDASPVISDKVVTGIALLLFDVTEKQNAEQLRREFTANVSHELKTPLHSICGYAELLKSDIMNEKDMKPFADKIYSEAQRMVNLVEDIINLSHLDEGAGDMTFEKVDLYEAASSALNSLEAEAKACQVTTSLEGAHLTIDGIPHMISAIVFNLCDNAIKYNRPDGTVTVTIKEEDGKALLQVRDTGIGISPDHQSRIFERFYRVDKSHSKEVGGTGLGLSIVKHAVMIHNAKVQVESEVGQGTCITVSFNL